MTRNARELLTISQVAARLGVHPGSIRRAERERRLPPSRRSDPVTRTRLYVEDDVVLIREFIKPRRRTNAA